MVAKGSASDPAAIVVKIEDLYRKVREHLVWNPLRPHKKERVKEPNASLKWRHELGTAIEEYRVAYVGANGSGYGAEWAKSLGEEIGGKMANAELYAHRRYALLFSEREIEGHVRAGKPWRQAKELGKGKPRLSGLASKRNERKRERPKSKKRGRAGARS